MAKKIVPNKDALFKYLLDAIAPEVTVNQLERANNPTIPERGWQSDFLYKKIIVPLTFEALELCWERDDLTDENQAQIIANFLLGQGTAHQLSAYVDGLITHAKGYIRNISTLVSDKLDDPKTLEYAEKKACAAFERMVKIQLAFTALPLIADEEIHNQLVDFIQQQTTFTVQDNILFRCHKAFMTSVVPSLSAYDKAMNEADSTIANFTDVYSATAGQVRQARIQVVLNMAKSIIYTPVKALNVCHSFLQRATAVFKAATQNAPDIRDSKLTIAIEMVGTGLLAWNSADWALPLLATMGTTVYFSWSLAAVGYYCYKLKNMSFAVARNEATQRSLIDIVVEENVARDLNDPIIIPPALAPFLSSAEREKALHRICKQRWRNYCVETDQAPCAMRARIIPLTTAGIIWTPIYNTRGAPAPIPAAALLAALDNGPCP